MGTPVTRCTQVSKRTTWAARANAASVPAASPTSASTVTFVAMSSHTRGASGATAARLAVTAGSTA